MLTLRVSATKTVSQLTGSGTRSYTAILDLNRLHCMRLSLEGWRVGRSAALLALVFLLGSAPSLSTAAPSPSMQVEIDHLFSYLERSGCRFNRNGTWYSAQEASDHLKKKRDYLVRKGLLSTTESFIELAASKSSRSGEPYLVECPGAPARASALWFQDELARYRRDSNSSQ